MEHDTETLELYVAGSTTLANLYMAHASWLYRLACLMVLDRTEAEDLVHDTFVRAVGHLDHLEADTAGGYLRTILCNLVRSRARRLVVEHRHRPPRPPEAEAADACAIRQEDGHEVIEALGRLSRRQRECLVCRYYADMADAEIAAALGISVNSVSTHISRAMSSMGRAVRSLR